MTTEELLAKVEEIKASVVNDYPCDRCIYFAGDYHPALCLNPYRKVDPVLDNIVSVVVIDGGSGKCPGLVEGEPAWLRIFLSSDPSPPIEVCKRMAKEIEREFEQSARLELFRTPYVKGERGTLNMQESKSPPNDEMRSDRIVRAFHGTTLENAMNILRVGFQKTLGVCGMGAYFDIGDSRSAVERAIEKSENPLEARIIEVELHPGNCIDLQAPEVVATFKRWQSNYRQQFGEAVFHNRSFAAQKELYLSQIHPDADAAMLVDKSQNHIIGMQNTQNIRILQVRTISSEEIEQYGRSNVYGPNR
ncbi:hypothetical protein HYR99_33125 [Candidatus Poribacteria bacterium]|nr:hypothetical protein [Candidatus Poribacteria bacterium]